MNSRLGYINKEKDYESGLRDHGVRKYDDLSGRFISVDPLWSKYIGWTPYHYCENDPVNAEDGNGMLPGDLFNSPAQAAHDFGKNYNQMSIDDEREYTSTIYPVYAKAGNVFYTYRIPIRQQESEGSIPIHKNDIAMLHTHGNYTGKLGIGNDVFSIKDKFYSELFKMPSYLVTPDGYLQIYNPKTKMASTISKDMPRDKRDPKTKKNKTPEVYNDEKRSKPYYPSLKSQGYEARK